VSDWSLAQMFHVSPGSTCDLLAKFLRDMAVFSCFALPANADMTFSLMIYSRL
jgi:hypothetical protein